VRSGRHLHHSNAIERATGGCWRIPGNEGIVEIEQWWRLFSNFLIISRKFPEYFDNNFKILSTQY
jgi:hypothetical protein